MSRCKARQALTLHRGSLGVPMCRLTAQQYLVQGSEAGQAELRPKHRWLIEIGQPAWRDVLLLVEQPLAEALPRHLVLQGPGALSNSRPAGADRVSTSTSGRACPPGSWKVVVPVLQMTQVPCVYRYPSARTSVATSASLAHTVARVHTSRGRNCRSTSRRQSAERSRRQVCT